MINIYDHKISEEEEDKEAGEEEEGERRGEKIKFHAPSQSSHLHLQ